MVSAAPTQLQILPLINQGPYYPQATSSPLALPSLGSQPLISQVEVSTPTPLAPAPSDMFSPTAPAPLPTSAPTTPLPPLPLIPLEGQPPEPPKAGALKQFFTSPKLYKAALFAGIGALAALAGHKLPQKLGWVTVGSAAATMAAWLGIDFLAPKTTPK